MPALPQLGATELLILMSIILLFFGAKRIPELARSLGKGTREFRKGISEDETRDDEARDAEKEEPAPSTNGATLAEAAPHTEPE